jgi:hypothetical protein
MATRKSKLTKTTKATLLEESTSTPSIVDRTQVINKARDNGLLEDVINAIVNSPHNEFTRALQDAIDAHYTNEETRIHLAPIGPTTTQ